jgi:hypothetical protein
MTRKLKSRILQFALVRREWDLLLSASCCHNEGPPDLGFFSWARRYCAARPGLLEYPAVYTRFVLFQLTFETTLTLLLSFKNLVLGYPNMRLRLRAVKKLLGTKPSDLPLPELSDWLPSVIKLGDGDAEDSLLESFEDGYALGEVAASMGFHRSIDVYDGTDG